MVSLVHYVQNTEERYACAHREHVTRLCVVGWKMGHNYSEWETCSVGKVVVWGLVNVKLYL